MRRISLPVTASLTVPGVGGKNGVGRVESAIAVRLLAALKTPTESRKGEGMSEAGGGIGGMREMVALPAK